MIERLKIERFKSIRRLDMECRRINLFIGEPNVGKSNILEALGLLSWCGLLNVPLKDFVRFQSMQHIFYDCLTDEPILIDFEGKIKPRELVRGVMVKLEKDHFAIGVADPNFQPLVH